MHVTCSVKHSPRMATTQTTSSDQAQDSLSPAPSSAFGFYIPTSLSSLHSLHAMATIIHAQTLPTEQPIQATLLTLPAEIRNSICRFALLHEEGGGIISPCGSATSRGVVLKGDTRFRIKSNKPVRLKGLDSASDEVKAAVAKEYSRYVYRRAEGQQDASREERQSPS